MSKYKLCSRQAERYGIYEKQLVVILSKAKKDEVIAFVSNGETKLFKCVEIKQHKLKEPEFDLKVSLEHESEYDFFDY